MTVGVYVLIGADDRPIYIGKSICVEKRVRQHYLDPTRHERLGGKTKGEATHRVEVIECAREELDAAEKRVIAERGPVLNVLDSMTDYAVHRRNVIRENARRPRPNPVVPLEYRASPGFAEAVQNHVGDLDAQIRAIVDLAPPFTPSQRDKLAALLADEAPKPKRASKSRGVTS